MIGVERGRLLPWSPSTAMLLSTTSPYIRPINAPSPLPVTTALPSSISSAAAATDACASTRNLLWSSSMRPVTTFLWSPRRRFLFTRLRMHAYCSNWNAPSPFYVLLLLGGKILHIDFGDYFEASMNREKFPEKSKCYRARPCL
ncbi:uncharacterized protein LOC124838137 isoform X2 [Vigna umbellata]|uniref:uncharacterized protein LOC124838137 isoform X2 n=1 Tax=Vigna umbellata TaxID=87088 RepID=UPI001F5F0385|nr:uncharacterized protein LOC124838137 isoform X2 [Vigna umbellata]